MKKAEKIYFRRHFYLITNPTRKCIRSILKQNWFCILNEDLQLTGQEHKVKDWYKIYSPASALRESCVHK